MNTPPPPEFWFSSLILQGHVGVSLFMVLCGYLFASLTLKREIDYFQFILNRILRLFPLFYLFLIIYVVTNKVSTLNAFVSIITLLNFADNMPWGMWTILVEFQFYLIFPLIMRSINNNNFRWAFFLLITSLFLRILFLLTFDSVKNLSYFSIVGRIDQFIIGMLSAVILTPVVSNYSQMRKLLLLSSILFLFSLIYYFFNKQGGWFIDDSHFPGGIIWVFLPLVEAIFLSLIVSLYCSIKIPKFFDSILSKLGLLTYGIYLCHFFIIAKVGGIVVYSLGITPHMMSSSFFTAWFAATFIVFPIVIFCAFLLYYSIEKPFILLRKPYLI